MGQNPSIRGQIRPERPIIIAELGVPSSDESV